MSYEENPSHTQTFPAENQRFSVPSSILSAIAALVLLLTSCTTWSASIVEPAISQGTRQIVMIFHENYCSNARDAIDHYLTKVKSIGYNPVLLCTRKKGINQLRIDIENILTKQNLNRYNVSGINIYGAVISDKLAPQLPEQLKQPVHLESLLVFEPVELIFQGDQVIDLVAEPQLLTSRWVAHLFRETNDADQELSNYLYRASEKLSHAYRFTEGFAFLQRMDSQILEAGKTLASHQSLPLLGMTGAPVLFLSRRYINHFIYNSHRTLNAYLGLPILYDIGNLLVSIISVHGYYKNKALSWKRIALSSPLKQDGLIISVPSASE